MIKIFPSLMAAPQLNLERTIKLLDAYCDGFHLDVMDDHFVPNLGMSASTVNQIARMTTKQLSVHLMAEKPEELLASFQLKKNDVVSFHVESAKNPDVLIKEIKKKHLQASIALKPKTPVEKIYPYLPQLDQVLIMTVEPGFSGQPLLPETFKKIETLSNYKKVQGLFTVLAVDGGITKDNIQKLAQLGVENFSVGSGIFGATDPVEALQELYARAKTS